MSNLFFANIETFFRGVGDNIKNSVEFVKEKSEEVDELKADIKKSGREFVVETANDFNPELGEKIVEHYRKKDNRDASLNNLLGSTPGKKISSISELNRGDHICISCFMGVFSHHAIYIGNSQIIHYTESAITG